MGQQQWEKNITRGQESCVIFKKSVTLALVFSFFVLSGCTGELAGQIGGGSIGALIGSQIGQGNGRLIATAIGAVAGAALGGALGKKFDQEDKKRAERAAQQAAATGKSVQWSNPNSGAHGNWQAGPIQYGPRNQCYRQLKCLAMQPNGQAVTLFVNAYQGADGHWYMAQ
jgi:surface antigen